MVADRYQCVIYSSPASEPHRDEGVSAASTVDSGGSTTWLTRTQKMNSTINRNDL